MAAITLKRAQTVFELAATAATGDGEIELYTPVAFVPGGLNGGYDGSVGHALEDLCRLSVVLLAQSKEVVRRSDGTRLMGVLPVDA